MATQARNGIDEVLAQSIKELSRTRPIDKITIKEITDKAGVIRPTFYNHFQDKYELLEWIVQVELMEPAKPFFQNGLIREGITFVFTAIEKETEFYQKAAKLEGQNSFREMLLRAIKDILLERMDMEKVRSKIAYPWLTDEVIASYYGNMACIVVLGWIQNGMKIPVNELVDVSIAVASDSMMDNIMPR